MNNLRILIIDDDEEIWKAYCAVLSPRDSRSSASKEMSGLLTNGQEEDFYQVDFQLSYASQGGQGFSQVIFFESAAALKAFTQGEYEFGAEASAVAITLGASVKAGSGGAAVGASLDKNKAKVAGAYNNGMAIFTVVKGGLMYEAAIAGQKFKFSKR